VSTELTMPMLGEVMEEGTVQTWNMKEGDTVEKGQMVLVIETDKSVFDIEAPASGTVTKILVQEGETVPINTPLAVIE
jgi:pyruvate/2-oxoglutarate dehydrogenase complex dihydrolipoamide acyltransferase (E2) component